MKMELIASLLHQPKCCFSMNRPSAWTVSQKSPESSSATTRAKDDICSRAITCRHQALCDRVIIIDRGKIFFDGRLGEIVDRFADSNSSPFNAKKPDDYPAENLARYVKSSKKTPLHQVQGQTRRVIPVCKSCSMICR